jgi:hypothetical protein
VQILCNLALFSESVRGCGSARLGVNDFVSGRTEMVDEIVLEDA